MTDIVKLTRFIGYRDSEQYLYMEMDMPFSDGVAPEWVVEVLPANRFQPWRRFDGIAEPGVVSYVANPSCDETELIAGGFADCRRVIHPDTVL